MASFSVINEARKLASPGQTGRGVQLNGLLHDLLDRGFFTSELLAIRRLTDASWGIEGDRAVWSLTSLLGDMLCHHKLLTRQAIFESENLEYDYDLVEKKKLELLDSNKGKICFVPPELNSGHVLMRHIWVSQLSGVKVSKRQPGDTVSSDVFENLKKKVSDACEDAGKYVNKFLAHAAAPEDRARAGADELQVTLATLKKAHQTLCEVVVFLRVFVLGDAHPSFLPVPQYNIWAHIEEPLITRDQIDHLRSVWNDCHDEWNRWGNWGSDGYELEFGSSLA